MVLNTSHVLDIFSHMLTRDMSIAMIQPGGVRLCCRFWLDTLTLIMIVNVSGARNVSTCDTFNHGNQLITHGYAQALPLWAVMHSRPQETPKYLRYYNQLLQDQFARIYLANMDGTGHESGRINWRNPDIILKACKAFDTFGSWIIEKFPTKQWAFHLGTSFKLYARLPTNKGEPREAVFSSSSGLPCKQVYNLELKSPMNLREISILPDFLLEKTLPVCFLCQIPVKCLQAIQFGQKAQALHQSNRILSDHRLHSALYDVQDSYKDSIQHLKQACCISVGQGVKYPMHQQNWQLLLDVRYRTYKYEKAENMDTSM
ncbi:hypothetical protein RSOL_021160, partial [Rhizoctonia solani AG-3 Rhs1AP]